MFRMLLFFVALSMATPAMAHNADQLPFVQIDNIDAKVYPVPSTSLVDFPLPQDLAAKTHLPGDLVTVGIVTQNLPILPEYIAQTSWQWNFGDGTIKSGLKAEHAYSKPGSYLIDLHSITGSDAPQLLDRIQVNVLPETNYPLPKAVVSIDGHIPGNPYTDILSSTYGYSAHFEGNTSKGEGITYFWDFGDTNTATTVASDHTFNPPYLYVSVLLRVTDKYGLVGDQFAQLQDLDKKGAPTLDATPPRSSSTVPLRAVSLISAVIILAILITLRMKQK